MHADRQEPDYRFGFGSCTCAVYGFGSFFRSSEAKDIDILVVLDNSVTEPGRAHRNIEQVFRDLNRPYAPPFDLTVLLQSEFEQRLLREHDSLVPLAAF